jgi:hypothetical protein
MSQRNGITIPMAKRLSNTAMVNGTQSPDVHQRAKLPFFGHRTILAWMSFRRFIRILLFRHESYGVANR